MPIWLRRFTFEKLKDYYEKQKEETDKQTSMIKNTASKTPLTPNIPKPTYTTKAAKK